jgi:hypothetical protein
VLGSVGGKLMKDQRHRKMLWRKSPPANYPAKYGGDRASSTSANYGSEKDCGVVGRRKSAMLAAFPIAPLHAISIAQSMRMADAFARCIL